MSAEAGTVERPPPMGMAGTAPGPYSHRNPARCQPINAQKLCKCIIMSCESKIYGDLLWDLHTLTECDKR